MFDYYNWNEQKISINTNKNRLFFHEREVWFTSLGLNIGFEQNGKGNNFLRPVLILKKFSKDLLWVVPLSTAQKTGKYYHSIVVRNVDNVALLSQIRLIDSKRLQYKIGDVQKDDLSKIKEKLKLLLE
jgi:mRNA-degrading endonuclease toxin of MazEF toxin-antitoxin module